MKASKTLSICCILLTYLTIWYAYPAYQASKLDHFIQEWNEMSEAPYYISHENISIQRNIFSLPLSASLRICNMRLIMKNTAQTIASAGDIEICRSCYDTDTEGCAQSFMLLSHAN